MAGTNKKPSLIFPKASTKVGLPYSISDNWEVSPRRACRELIQNALDAHAALPAPQDHPCKVTFKTARIKAADIPAFDVYRKALDTSLRSWSSNPSVSAYLKSLQEYALKSAVEVLYVIDNGMGFQPKNLEAVLAEGTPEKQAGSSGSFGIGHLTAFGLSGLQYIFYGSKSESGELLGAGHAILSSFPDAQTNELRSNHGYFLNEYTTKFDKPFIFCTESDVPQFLREQIEAIPSSGSVVAVLGFKGFRGLTEDGSGRSEFSKLIREAVAENFALAICANSLEVIVETSDGHSDQVDKSSIIAFLEWMARPDTGSKEQTLEAELTLEAIETFHNADKSDNLQNPFCDCELRMRNGVSSHSVSVWRNGMLITRTHRGFSKGMFDGKKPINAVVMLTGRADKPVAHDLVKKAETPLHDKIQEKRLSGKREKDQLKKLLSMIRQWLQMQATDSGGETKELDDDILLSTGATELFKLDPIRTRVRDDNGDPEEFRSGSGSGSESRPGPKPKKRRVTSKNLAKAKAQGRMQKNAYLVRIMPSENVSGGVLEITRVNGQDSSCVGLIQDALVEVRAARRVGGGDFSLEDGSVLLGDLTKGRHIDVELVFSEPAENLAGISLGCHVGTLLQVRGKRAQGQ